MLPDHPNGAGQSNPGRTVAVTFAFAVTIADADLLRPPRRD
jgi:hypothetical protein